MKEELKKKLFKYARETIKSGLKGDKFTPKNVPLELKEKRGVFVTIYKKNKVLRGCIGIVEAVKPLYKAVIDSAHASAFSDPRFKRLREDEYKDITLEISVLYPPVELTSKNPKDIIIGEHGLIIELGIMKGLLLPQVATEWGFKEEDFLEAVSEKAGLPSNAWKDPRTKIYTFKAEVLEE